MAKDANEPDVLDPRRWGLPKEAVADLADRPRRFWLRFRHCFKTRDASHNTLGPI